jgi:hypothetical protein
MANVSKMNKKQLIAHGKNFGIKLDEGMVKKTMVQLIRDKALAPEKPPKPKEAVIVGAPVDYQVPHKRVFATPEQKGFWKSIKNFFGV